MSDTLCPTCSFENREGINFCTECGARIQAEEPNGPCLVMLYGEGQELIFPIRKNRTTIGRDIDSDIVLRDVKISKKHATVVLEDDNFWIEDLESKNGVYVNGRHISDKRRLVNGNLIKLGFTIFRFEYEKVKVS